MDDVDAKIAAMEQELAQLNRETHALADRLVGGERTLRPELNAAIGRGRELRSELHKLKISSGRWVPEPPVMYGPPARLKQAGNRRGFWRRLFNRK